MTVRPTHLVRRASPAVEKGLKQARSGKPGCIGLLAALSVKFHLGYACSSGAKLLHLFVS